jgi:hypothetical protein
LKRSGVSNNVVKNRACLGLGLEADGILRENMLRNSSGFIEAFTRKNDFINYRQSILVGQKVIFMHPGRWANI